MIKERQSEIERTGEASPMVIFPEGTTTNGTALLKMKKGAFYGRKTITPIVLKYSTGSCSPAWSANDLIPLIFF